MSSDNENTFMLHFHLTDKKFALLLSTIKSDEKEREIWLLFLLPNSRIDK